MSRDVDVQPVPVNKTPLGPEAASQDTTCATFSPSDLRDYYRFRYCRSLFWRSSVLTTFSYASPPRNNPHISFSADCY